MIASHIDTIRWSLLLLLVLAACSVDPKANDRYDSGLPEGLMYRGFCKEPRDASVSAPTFGRGQRRRFGDGQWRQRRRRHGGAGRQGRRLMQAAATT